MKTMKQIKLWMNTIGTYLHRYGFDIDFAPVADVNTNPENIVIGQRAFSDDPAVAAPMETEVKIRRVNSPMQ